MTTQAHRYHPGEIRAHELAGLVEQAEHSRGAIGASVPPAAAAFLARQPLLVVGAADRAGHLWASLLTGPPGFAGAVDPGTLEVAARPVPGDPLGEALAGPARVGVIAIEPAARRRMRVNGRSEPTATGVRVTADQVYANCPKYIRQRGPRPAPQPRAPAAGATTAVLTPSQQAWIGSADTFFVATRSAAGDADASHRGGNPGFVQVLSDTELRWPDYTGNAMLMTLGNLQQDPAAGLLFVDWREGTTLQLTGTATVDWHASDELPGAERVVRFRLRRAVQVDHASPLVWSEPAFSRHNPPASTGAP